MTKKMYVKPEITMVGLRIEERLANCIGHTYQFSPSPDGCNKLVFPEDYPSTCTITLQLVPS
ncbi:MAG TPA: hypothetical protein GXX20_08590 [Clostridiaceae bacterium]|nr:hypothetical protein [Clostridiaceae bacterium]